MWHHIWPDLPLEAVPIGSVTNGVHMPSWVAPEVAASDPSAEDLWARHEGLRARLVDFVRARLDDAYYEKQLGLMHQVQGDLDSGYEIVLDGPASLFRLTDKYGLRMAGFLPALLLCFCSLACWLAGCRPAGPRE